MTACKNKKHQLAILVQYEIQSSNGLFLSIQRGKFCIETEGKVVPKINQA